MSVCTCMYIRQNCKPKQTARRQRRQPCLPVSPPRTNNSPTDTCTNGVSCWQKQKQQLSCWSWIRGTPAATAASERRRQPLSDARRAAHPLLLSTSTTTTSWFCPRLVLVTPAATPAENLWQSWKCCAAFNVSTSMRSRKSLFKLQLLAKFIDEKFNTEAQHVAEHFSRQGKRRNIFVGIRRYTA